MNWDVVKFGQLYAIPSRNGLMRPSKVRGNGFKMINMGELFAYPIIKNPEMERVQVSARELPKYTVQNGDLLFARQSLVLEGAGKCSIVSLTEDPTVYESHLIRVRLNRENSDPFFYFHFFNSQVGAGFIQQIVNQVAAAGIRGSDLEKLKVIHPPLHIQKKIAAVLSTYDELIEVNKKRITLLEEVTEEIYQEWFVRMRFPDWQTVKFVKGIPEGWIAKRISSFASFKYGYTESAIINDQFPKFLRVTDINKASYISWETVPNCKITELDQEKYGLSKNDIVIARMADPGKVAIIEDETSVVFASYLIKIKYDPKIVSPYYLFYTLKTDYYQEYFSNANSGSTRGSINGNTIGSTSVLIPRQEISLKFDEVIKPYRSQIVTLLKSNMQLKISRDLLLARLLSGKLIVNELDILFPPGMALDTVKGKSK